MTIFEVGGGRRWTSHSQKHFAVEPAEHNKERSESAAPVLHLPSGLFINNQDARPHIANLKGVHKQTEKTDNMLADDIIAGIIRGALLLLHSRPLDFKFRIGRRAGVTGKGIKKD